MLSGEPCTSDVCMTLPINTIQARQYNYRRQNVLDIIKLVTFRASRRRREMYSGHTRLSVCLSVCLSVRDRMPTLLHGPGCNLGEW